MEMSSFWKMIPVAAFAALALVACDSGSSSDPGAAESSSAAALPNGLESSCAATSSSAVVMSSGIVAEPISSGVVQSSAAKSSSSAAAPASSDGSTSTGAWPYLNPAISYGEFTDPRDGQVYKTVVIGTQTWMAENLNYAVDSSWCYGNSAGSCSKYGRLYQWASAMGVSPSYNDATLGGSVNHQGACPGGWHVPTSGEWTALETAVSSSDSAGAKLKGTSGWLDYEGVSGNGMDDYGFSALPAGLRDPFLGFYSGGSHAFFWSATEYVKFGTFVAYQANMRILRYSDADMYASHDAKDDAFSVRCVKD